MRANSPSNLKGMNVLKDIILLGLLMVSCSSPSNSSTTSTSTSGGSTGVHIRVQQVTDLQCGSGIDMTNTGDTTIQIEQIQMQMLTNPQHTTYNLINICSLAITRASDLTCPPGGRGGGPIDYTYKIQLGAQNTSRVLQGSRNANPSAPFDPTLTPGKTVEVNIDFELSGNTQNMNYIIIPEVTVDAIGGKQVIPQPQLKATLDIVTPRQLACYTLQSDTNTFVQVPPGPQPKVWCL
jgi:hypothetical protein